MRILSRLAYAIREHNVLNGFRFVIVEFGLVAIAALFIAFSGILHHRVLVILSGLGIACNALFVVGIAIQQLLRKERDAAITQLLSKEYRVKVAKDHPGLQWRTLYIAICVLVPFLILLFLSQPI